MKDTDDHLGSTSRRTVLRWGGTAGAAVLGAGTASALGGRRDREQRRFVSVQRSSNAVPPEESAPQRGGGGLSVFALDRAGETLYWTAVLDDVENVTGVHIHRGSADENGPHLVELYNPEEPTDELEDFSTSGAFGPGDACTEADFPAPDNCITQPGQPSGPPEAVTFEDVVAEIRSGETYVQVHTEDGVMRGQIR